MVMLEFTKPTVSQVAIFEINPDDPGLLDKGLLDKGLLDKGLLGFDELGLKQEPATEVLFKCLAQKFEGFENVGNQLGKVNVLSAVDELLTSKPSKEAQLLVKMLSKENFMHNSVSLNNSDLPKIGIKFDNDPEYTEDRTGGQDGDVRIYKTNCFSGRNIRN